jgi:hypothetical protein
MNESISYGTASGRLMAGYAMTDLGAQRILEAAIRHGSIVTAEVTVTLTGRHPARFVVTANA